MTMVRKHAVGHLEYHKQTLRNVAEAGKRTHKLSHTTARCFSDTQMTRIHDVSRDVQWGTLEYHKQTLRNVAEASKRTHKLCAVMVDTLGREIVVQRPSTRGPDGWPVHEECVDVKAGGKVCSPPPRPQKFPSPPLLLVQGCFTRSDASASSECRMQGYDIDAMDSSSLVCSDILHLK